MADALCGPSNPLQTFRKQTQLDRTLQQDRLVGLRGSAEQGFRTHDPRTGTLDADIYAFEHGISSPLPLQFQQPPPSQGFAPPPAATGWAADFQKLQISGRSTPVRFATPPQQTNAGWGNEFMTHQRIGTPVTDVKGKQAVQEPSLQGAIYNTAAYSQQPYQPQFQMQPMQHSQTSQQQMPSEMQISDTDFEAAFQDALQHVQELEEVQQEATERYNWNGIEIDDIPRTKQQPIGSDAINYIEQADRTQDQDTRDADELAKTAGQLLNIVQHDTSDKMKNSQFLDLMRRIRDREVEVQNNDLQQTNKQTSASNIPQKDARTEDIGDLAFFPNHPRQGSEAVLQSQRASEATQSHDPNTFTFPDMDSVYAYTAQTESGQSRPASADMSYSSHDDEYPRSQVQALHPGGRWYPEQHPPRLARAEFQSGQGVEQGNDLSMSGGVAQA